MLAKIRLAREAEELTTARQNLRAAPVNRGQGWNGEFAPVNANLPVVLVAGPWVLAMSLLDWPVPVWTSQGILLLKVCRLV